MIRSLCAAWIMATKFAVRALSSVAIAQDRWEPTSPPCRMLIPLPKVISSTMVETAVRAMVTFPMAVARHPGERATRTSSSSCCLYSRSRSSISASRPRSASAFERAMKTSLVSMKSARL